MIDRLRGAWAGLLHWWEVVVRRRDRQMSEEWRLQQLQAEESEEI